MQFNTISTDRLTSSIRLVTGAKQSGTVEEDFLEDLSLLVGDFHNSFLDRHLEAKDPARDSFVAHVFLISQLPVSDLELEGICRQGQLPEALLPLGVMYKVAFTNIRQFLHPNSEKATLRELRGRYMTASFFIEVATFFLAEQLKLPIANRVFWGLGGSLFIVPPHFGPKLKGALSEFNKTYGIPELGFELVFADTKTDVEFKEKKMLAPSETPISVPRDKLFGWQEFKGESSRSEAEFVANLALSLADSTQWCFRESTCHQPGGLDLASKLGSLPYWVYPAVEDEAALVFARSSYLAELGNECSFLDTSLETLASSDQNNIIHYYRLDISGMRESFALENEKGIEAMYKMCHQMELFFRETIPRICRDFNENQETDLEVALLHSTCDDLILVTKGREHGRLIEEMRTSCRNQVAQKLVYGGVALQLGLSASDLSRAAMIELVASKKAIKVT